MLAPGGLEIVHFMVLDLVGYSKLSFDQQASIDRMLRETVCCLPTYSRAMDSGKAVSLDTGDGIIVCFREDPTLPLDAAIEFAHSWVDKGAQPCRIGVHSGPATSIIDIGGHLNYKGVGVNVAARVLDCAKPNEITMTEHYASMVGCFERYTGKLQSKGAFRVKHGVKLRICVLCEKAFNQSSKPIRKANPTGLAWFGIGSVLLASTFAAGAMYGGRSMATPPQYLPAETKKERPIQMPYPYYLDPDRFLREFQFAPAYSSETYADGSIAPFLGVPPKKRS